MGIRVVGDGEGRGWGGGGAEAEEDPGKGAKLGGARKGDLDLEEEETNGAMGN